MCTNFGCIYVKVHVRKHTGGTTHYAPWREKKKRNTLTRTYIHTQAKNRTLWDLLGQPEADLEIYLQPWEFVSAVVPSRMEGSLSLAQPLAELRRVQETVSSYKAADARFGNNPDCTVSHMITFVFVHATICIYVCVSSSTDSFLSNAGRAWMQRVGVIQAIHCWGQFSFGPH
jgi:hypothetical protein